MVPALPLGRCSLSRTAPLLSVWRVSYVVKNCSASVSLAGVLFCQGLLRISLAGVLFCQELLRISLAGVLHGTP